MQTNEEQPKSAARSAAEIQQEYASLCAQAGQNTYQIRLLESSNVKIFARFNELNSEMNAAKGAENAKSDATE